MKIAIYGTSRSGKDYLIDRVLKYLSKFGIKAIHLKGSTILNEQSIKIFNKKFKSLDHEKQCNLRKLFNDIVDETAQTHSVVLVDGHYAFMEGNEFNVVFTEFDKFCYDHFFYLDTPSEIILKYSRNSDGVKRNLSIQLADIQKWKEFEKDELTKVCNSLEKEFVILDENTNDCVEFIKSWVMEYTTRYDYSNIASTFIDNIINKGLKIKTNKAFIFDCDRTLSIDDATYDFCHHLGIEKTQLKHIFSGDRYSSYQFYKFTKLFSAIDKKAINQAASFARNKIEISPQIKRLLHNNSNDLSIAITAGLTEIWSKQISDMKHIDIIFGNSSLSTNSYFVTPLFKMSIVKQLQKYGFIVTSFGDSIIDVPMLESSNYGFIIAHKKINKAVLKYLNTHPNSNLCQLLATNWCYPVNQF